MFTSAFADYIVCIFCQQKYYSEKKKEEINEKPHLYSVMMKIIRILVATDQMTANMSTRRAFPIHIQADRQTDKCKIFFFYCKIISILLFSKDIILALKSKSNDNAVQLFTSFTTTIINMSGFCDDV